jgi:hypothetical protein
MVNYDELKTAVALLVDTYKPWDLWTTFTFKYECRDYTAEKCFRRFMSQYLLRKAKYF